MPAAIRVLRKTRLLVGVLLVLIVIRLLIGWAPLPHHLDWVGATLVTAFAVLIIVGVFVNAIRARSPRTRNAAVAMIVGLVLVTVTLGVHAFVDGPHHPGPGGGVPAAIGALLYFFAAVLSEPDRPPQESVSAH